jgi:hypothetical protein
LRTKAGPRRMRVDSLAPGQALSLVHPYGKWSVALTIDNPPLLTANISCH